MTTAATCVAATISGIVGLAGVVWVPPVWMRWTEVRRAPLMRPDAPAFRLHD